MAALPEKRYTPDEYLALERVADEKSEYWDGYIYAMAGARRGHNLIVSNVNTTLNNQLRDRPCEVYPSDMKVRALGRRRYFYPDVSVVCGEPILEDDHGDVLLNPTVVVEVLSDSTERFDRGRKFDSYRSLASLQVYVLIAQDAPTVHVYHRQSDGQWLFSAATSLDETVRLPSIDCELPLAEVYRKVPLPTDDE